tara:strand:+ start:1935 stop:2891 length:957 start_codon:yes stop_codon:yes gene_type:complete
MDPFTIALATFGVQKLRGKSTRTALKDAALMGGIGQFAGMAGFGPFRAFGSTSLPGMTGRFVGGPAAGAMGPVPSFGKQVQIAPGESMGGVKRLIGEKAMTADQIKAAGLEGKAAEAAAKGSGFMGLGTGEKIGLTLAATSLLEDEDDVKPPFTDEDYKKAYEKNKKELEGITEGYDYGTDVQPQSNIYDYTSQDTPYTFNKGGIVNALPTYNTGGINYLPSKADHDEHDVNNYVRASGYVEDGAGAGDKDEDTMLAQLADGEFVSRADAILGAGILEGGNPSDMKDMRKKGAAFFYSQQAKFKRIFDLLDAARKEKN